MAGAPPLASAATSMSSTAGMLKRPHLGRLMRTPVTLLLVCGTCWCVCRPLLLGVPANAGFVSQPAGPLLEHRSRLARTAAAAAADGEEAPQAGGDPVSKAKELAAAASAAEQAARESKAQGGSSYDVLTAKAAMARAKADLAAAEAKQVVGEASFDAAMGSSSSPSQQQSLESLLDAVVEERQAEDKPERLLRSREGSNMLDMLARFEQTKLLGEQTALGFVTSSLLAQLSMIMPTDMGGMSTDPAEPSRDGRTLSKEVLDDFEVVRSAITPEAVFGFMNPEDLPPGIVSRPLDVRPLVAALARARNPVRLIEQALPWSRIFPEPLTRACGITEGEARLVTLDFVRRALEETPGYWTDAQMDEAAKLVEQDTRLKMVVNRVKTDVSSMGNVVNRSMAALPLLVLALFVGVCCCLSNLGGGGGGGGGGGVVGSDNLPLLTLAGQKVSGG
eukprot:TRINITY_DN25207_c0_g1_i1.p1 TRINITY_DN25207_c0_g1~~TRINITY_DN25207_c0_g1_i1.p1  ORF type:complete len:449 (-),score=106.92 TRINITY_DN25207_c0_g1_i1:43-1389(-)